MQIILHMIFLPTHKRSLSCPCDSCWIPVIPVDSGGIKFGGGPCQISIPGTPYSGGIELFQNLDRNGPERNPAECNKILILLVNLTRD